VDLEQVAHGWFDHLSMGFRRSDQGNGHEIRSTYERKGQEEREREMGGKGNGKSSKGMMNMFVIVKYSGRATTAFVNNHHDQTNIQISLRRDDVDAVFVVKKVTK
jgi:hypothetical protein